jgi:hypothetical protein
VAVDGDAGAADRAARRRQAGLQHRCDGAVERRVVRSTTSAASIDAPPLVAVASGQRSGGNLYHLCPLDSGGPGLRAIEGDPQATHAQRRARFGIRSEERDRFVRAGVERADDHGASDHELAFTLSRLSDQDLDHTVTGIFRNVDRATYDDGAPAQLQLARERAAATAGMLIGNTVPTTNNAMSAMIETNAVLGSRASWPVVCVFGDCNLHCWLSGLANSSVHHVSIEWRHVSW